MKVDHVTVRTFSDGSALSAALQTGDIQGTYGLPYDNYVLFDGNPAYEIHSAATSRCFFGQFNMESELMQDVRVRKAIEMGILEMGQSQRLPMIRKGQKLFSKKPAGRIRTETVMWTGTVRT